MAHEDEVMPEFRVIQKSTRIDGSVISSHSCYF